MFENLEIFRMAHAMSSHAGTRQSVIAQNIANADTPGYKARDIAPFDAHMATTDEGFALRATRPAHLNGVSDTAVIQVADRPDATADPNGNSVSLDTEMMHAVNTKRQHDRAMAIYRSSLSILRSAIGRR